jgi:hypothetical protein
VIVHDYFAPGPLVEMSGTVDGDVYAAGGQVLIDGRVNGHVLVAGGRVMLSGVVTQNVRVVEVRIFSARRSGCGSRVRRSARRPAARCGRRRSRRIASRG